MSEHISVSMTRDLAERLKDVAAILEVSRPRVLKALLRRFLAESEAEEEEVRKLKNYL